MKTSVFSLAISITASALFLTSCGNDNLTENIKLDKSNKVVNTEISNRSAGEPFLFEEIVHLYADEAFGDIEKFGARGPDAEDKGQMERFQKQPNLAISGIGDSRILNWGSWYVVVDLGYDPTNNTVSGTLKFTYPDYGDEVEFGVSGQPALVVNNEDNSQQLMLTLEINQGTGRFEDKSFDGYAVLEDVEKLMDNAGDIKTYLVVNGEIVDR